MNSRILLRVPPLLRTIMVKQDKLEVFYDRGNPQNAPILKKLLGDFAPRSRPLTHTDVDVGQIDRGGAIEENPTAPSVLPNFHLSNTALRNVYVYRAKFGYPFNNCGGENYHRSTKFMVGFDVVSTSTTLSEAVEKLRLKP